MGVQQLHIAPGAIILALAAVFLAAPALGADTSVVPIDVNLSAWARARAGYHTVDDSGTNYAHAYDRYENGSHTINREAEASIGCTGASWGAEFQAGVGASGDDGGGEAEVDAQGTFTIGVTDAIPAGTPLQLLFVEKTYHSGGGYVGGGWSLYRGNQLLSFDDDWWGWEEDIMRGSWQVFAGESLRASVHAVAHPGTDWPYESGSFDMDADFWALRIPEPGTFVLFLAAALGLLTYARRKR